MSRHRDNTNKQITTLIKRQKVNDTSYLLTQFGATSPTSGGYQVRKEIHYNSISLKHA